MNPIGSASSFLGRWFSSHKIHPETALSSSAERIFQAFRELECALDIQTSSCCLGDQIDSQTRSRKKKEFTVIFSAFNEAVITINDLQTLGKIKAKYALLLPKINAFFERIFLENRLSEITFNNIYEAQIVSSRGFQQALARENHEISQFKERMNTSRRTLTQIEHFLSASEENQKKIIDVALETLESLSKKSLCGIDSKNELDLWITDYKYLFTEERLSHLSKEQLLKLILINIVIHKQFNQDLFEKSFSSLPDFATEFKEIITSNALSLKDKVDKISSLCQKNTFSSEISWYVFHFFIIHNYSLSEIIDSGLDKNMILSTLPELLIIDFGEINYSNDNPFVREVLSITLKGPGTSLTHFFKDRCLVAFDVADIKKDPFYILFKLDTLFRSRSSLPVIMLQEELQTVLEGVAALKSVVSTVLNLLFQAHSSQHSFLHDILSSEASHSQIRGEFREPLEQIGRILGYCKKNGISIVNDNSCPFLRNIFCLLEVDNIEQIQNLFIENLTQNAATIHLENQLIRCWLKLKHYSEEEILEFFSFEKNEKAFQDCCSIILRRHALGPLTSQPRKDLLNFAKKDHRLHAISLIGSAMKSIG